MNRKSWIGLESVGFCAAVFCAALAAAGCGGSSNSTGGFDYTTVTGGGGSTGVTAGADDGGAPDGGITGGTGGTAGPTGATGSTASATAGTGGGSAGSDAGSITGGTGGTPGTGGGSGNGASTASSSTASATTTTSGATAGDASADAKPGTCDGGACACDATSGCSPTGAGVGGACSTTIPCRSGLICASAGTCQAGHNGAIGAKCVLNDECASGLYCNFGTCAAQNTGDSGADAGGPAGALCNRTDADCGNGLRCAITGVGFTCAKQGSVDIGGACTAAIDCLGGLYCAMGKCAPSFPGSSLGVPTWLGATCDPETGPVQAWFRVPRGQSDGDFYRLPFPNDIRRSANGHPNLQGHPSPGPELLGVDVVDAYLRAIEKDNDGFGGYQTVYFRFSGGIDYTSLNTTGGVQFLDITPGDPALGQARSFNWTATSARGKYICANWMGVRMAKGEPLTSGHTYAVILSTAGQAPGGVPIVRSADLIAMLAAAPPADTALTAAYATYKPLRDYLAGKIIDPSTVLNAAVFTVGHIQNAAQVLSSSVEAMAPPVTSGWIKCGSGMAEPCTDATGSRACPTAVDPDFDELHALVSLPIFQLGTAPYIEPKDDGQIAISGTTATPTRSEQVCLALTVPKGAMPAAGWPVVIYAHGTGGSYRSHVSEGTAKVLAKAMAGATSVPIAMLGIDQVQHGPRRGGSTADPGNLFYNFTNPHAARDNAVQGAVDQVSLGRLAATLSIAAGQSPTGAAIKLDPAAVLFWGHSQGATEGGISTPFSTDIKGVLFSGQGASLMDGLLTKKQPVDVTQLVPYVLEDFDLTLKLTAGAYNPMLSLLQTYLDRSDPLNYGAAMAATPPTGITAHHVFQVYGQNDTFAPPVTESTYALAARLGIAPHDSSVTTPDDLGRPESTTGISANIAGKTAAVRQYAPSGYDGHFVVFQNAAARSDAIAFLAALAAGQVPRVGP